MSKTRRGAAVAAILLGLAAVTAGAEPSATNPPPAALAPIVVDYFYEAGCTECLQVQNEALPVLEAAYGGMYALHEYDIAIETNYLKLAEYVKRLGINENAHVFMIVDGQEVLAGADEIVARLVPVVEMRLTARLERPAPPAPEPPGGHASRATLTHMLEEFTVGGVIVAGLIDGINPCAFSTLVFLISVLSLSRAQGRHLLRIGAVFCLATFLTYTAIGFGLLHALRALSVFPLVRKAVDYVLLALLIGLAAYSFRDAFRFWRSGNPQDVALQLPDKLKGRIHRILRKGFGEKAQLASAFAIGIAVTGLESVCTGQLYVPTLAMVVKTGANVTRGLAYLLLYNLMFVVPLIAVFILTCNGLKLATLMAWSSKNVVLSKVLLGAFFLALAALMVALI